MNLQKTARVGLKFLVGSLFGGILFYTSGLKTNSSFLCIDDNDFLINPPAKGATRQFTKAFLTQANFAQDTAIAEGQALMNSSDCYTCHAEYKILLAPSFSEIAARYKNDKAAIQTLTNKVILGTIGSWGDKPMPPHPELLKEDVQKMIQYIMSLNKKKDSTKLPLKGS